jgi:hypothetical protein
VFFAIQDIFVKKKTNPLMRSPTFFIEFGGAGDCFFQNQQSAPNLPISFAKIAKKPASSITGRYFFRNSLVEGRFFSAIS